MSAGKFFRENFVIVIGIALPLALVLFFVLVRELPQDRVADPQYDLLFAKNYPAGANSRLEFSVAGGKLQVRYYPEKLNSNGYVINGTVPELFYYDVSKNAIHKIAIELPVDENGQVSDKVQYIDIPAATELRLESGNTSPDGYQFVYLGNRGGGLFTEIFVGNRRYRYVIEKEGRRIDLPTEVHYYNSQAIGWVISGELKD